MSSKTHATHSAAPTRGAVIHWAAFYDVFVRAVMLGRDRALREMTVDLAELRPGQQVLDVGCGTGSLTIAARRRVGTAGRVCGIDPAPEMIELARRKAAAANAAVDLQVGVIEAIPFPDRSFDTVLSSFMMHHLPDDLKRAGLAEIRRVLKPGGQLLIVDFKRPDNPIGRIGVTLLFHGALKTGVQDLLVPMREAGLQQVETGNTRFKAFGYARARTAA